MQGMGLRSMVSATAKKSKINSKPIQSCQATEAPRPDSKAAWGFLVEVDVKHLPNTGSKRYALVAVDVLTKQATVHVSSTISIAQGVLAWHKAVHQLGLPKTVLTDNGSENMGAFAKLLSEQPAEHYWARPHTPKYKPHVERFIGSLERECIQWGGVATDLRDQQEVINTWLRKYHSFRPHQSLGYLTPDEYKNKIHI